MAKEPKHIQLRGGFVTEDVRLDRLPSRNARRLSLFPASSLPQLQAVEDLPPQSKLHRRGGILDQSPEKGYDGSGCVGFSGLNFLRSSPVRNPRFRVEMGWVELEKIAAILFYHKAQERDEWPETKPDGEGGTSVDALGRYMSELGLYSEYHWATSLRDIVLALQLQPVIMGTWWTTGMDAADGHEHGVATFTGRKRGGHAWLCDAVMVDEIIGTEHSPYWFRGFNSWGPWGWHKRGTFWLSAATMEALLADQGECMVPTEVMQEAK